MKKCGYNILVFYRGGEQPAALSEELGEGVTLAALDQFRAGKDIDVNTVLGRNIIRREHIGYIAYQRVCEEAEAPTDAFCKEEP